MKTKINLYFDCASNTIDWRIKTAKDKAIFAESGTFSGEIESSHSFADYKQAQRDAINFCKLVGIRLDDVEFFDKEELAKPEITK